LARYNLRCDDAVPDKHAEQKAGNCRQYYVPDPTLRIAARKHVTGVEMPHLFVKIELRGTPDDITYNMLHNFMRQRHWYRTITGAKTVHLPPMTYQMHTESATDLVVLANRLKADIERNVWTLPTVLITQAEGWALAS
jgi:hypothetical protein